LAIVFAVACSDLASAQTTERPPLGSSITVDALGALPASANLFALLDTAVPDVIADRLDTGGLSAADPARIGAHGSTWTQTLFTLGDVDITDPSGSGTPLIVPGVDAWARVDVATGLMPIDRNAPGLAVTLIPRQASADWFRRLDLMASPPALNAGGATWIPPSITRLDTWLHANLLGAGPIVRDKLGVFMTVAATRSTHFERSSVARIDANVASAFINLVATPRAADDIRTVAWLQRSRDPIANHAALGQPNAGEEDVGVHAQSTWEHRFAGRDASVRAFAGFTTRNRTNELAAPAFAVVERLRDGPIPNLLDDGPGISRAWSLGARVRGPRAAAGAGRHDLAAGVEIANGFMSTSSSFAGRVGELINGMPARLWEFSDPREPSRWRTTTVSAYAGDTVALAPRVTINGALRFEASSGSRQADQAPVVSWRNWFPRAGVHWAVIDFWQLGTFGQYSRYGHRLPLRDLAYGDPTAPSGTVFRWNAPIGTTALQPGAIGPLVQRVGPGTHGDASFSAIDPGLRRPVMDEMILGFEARPHPSTFVRLAAIGRRERHLIGVVDIGVPQSTYSTIGVPDPGIDLIGSADDQILIFYNRSPNTFGADRYLLTNPSDDVTSFVGADFTGQVQAKRLYVLAGVTAGRSEGLSANRGFGPRENDAAVLGEVYINPNARGHAQGRVFTERGYTIKTATAYQFPRDVTFGLVGRYQDGQHFARLVIVPGLNQGAEAVRAFRNGRTRFTFSMTVDARLQKRFTIGGYGVTAVLDAYNVLNQALEVEEFSVTGATSRLTSAVQPPRVVQLGVRIPF